METLNSIYGKPSFASSQVKTNNNDFGQITETSNEDTDPEIKRTETYLSQLTFKFDKGMLEEFKELELQMQDFCANLLIFLRCELAARAYFAMREFSRVSFMSSQFVSNSNKETIKAESSITSLLSDYRRIFGLLTTASAGGTSFQLRSDFVYWIYSQTYVLCLRLFEKQVRYIREKKIDETGLERLKVSLEILNSEFQSFLATAEELMVQNNYVKEVELMLNFMKERN